ncbi:hypothetical protein [Desulfohalovibrio reitneri]|uniref:hypothetical protein n=1 Tax=Desulfohalovibrio reitneri TaxID=1307759 RepID=UPI0004A6EDA8|nr:hypothetical protein [Desulfohalovibrio reitneri]
MSDKPDFLDRLLDYGSDAKDSGGTCGMRTEGEQSSLEEGSVEEDTTEASGDRRGPESLGTLRHRPSRGSLCRILGVDASGTSMEDSLFRLGLANWAEEDDLLTRVERTKEGLLAEYGEAERRESEHLDEALRRIERRRDDLAGRLRKARGEWRIVGRKLASADRRLSDARGEKTRLEADLRSRRSEAVARVRRLAREEERERFTAHREFLDEFEEIQKKHNVLVPVEERENGRERSEAERECIRLQAGRLGKRLEQLGDLRDKFNRHMEFWQAGGVTTTTANLLVSFGYASLPMVGWYLGRTLQAVDQQHLNYANAARHLGNGLGELLVRHGFFGGLGLAFLLPLAVTTFCAVILLLPGWFERLRKKWNSPEEYEFRKTAFDAALYGKGGTSPFHARHLSWIFLLTFIPMLLAVVVAHAEAAGKDVVFTALVQQLDPLFIYLGVAICLVLSSLFLAYNVNVVRPRLWRAIEEERFAQSELGRASRFLCLNFELVAFCLALFVLLAVMGVDRGSGDLKSLYLAVFAALAWGMAMSHGLLFRGIVRQAGDLDNEIERVYRLQEKRAKELDLERYKERNQGGTLSVHSWPGWLKDTIDRIWHPTGMTALAAGRIEQDVSGGGDEGGDPLLEAAFPAETARRKELGDEIETLQRRVESLKAERSEKEREIEELCNDVGNLEKEMETVRDKKADCVRKFDQHRQSVERDHQALLLRGMPAFRTGLRLRMRMTGGQHAAKEGAANG